MAVFIFVGSCGSLAAKRRVGARGHETHMGFGCSKWSPAVAALMLKIGKIPRHFRKNCQFSRFLEGAAAQIPCIIVQLVPYSACDVTSIDLLLLSAQSFDLALTLPTCLILRTVFKGEFQWLLEQ